MKTSDSRGPARISKDSIAFVAPTSRGRGGVRCRRDARTTKDRLFDVILNRASRRAGARVDGFFVVGSESICEVAKPKGSHRSISSPLAAGDSSWALIVVFALVLAHPLLAASPPAASISLGESSGSVEVVRCHFDEGRLVIRHTEELHVLRKGEALGDTGLSVVEITPTTATLALRQGSPSGSLRIIRITRADNGALLLREYATDPAALASGAAAIAPRAATSAVADGKPTSAPDGG